MWKQLGFRDNTYYFEGKFDKRINVMAVNGFLSKNEVQLFLQHKEYMKIVCMLVRQLVFLLSITEGQVFISHNFSYLRNRCPHSNHMNVSCFLNQIFSAKQLFKAQPITYQ